MENMIILENDIKNILNQILNEEVSKVKREDYNRVQFKIEELQNSLTETMKEFRKLEQSIPEGLKSVSNGRVNGISSSLLESQKLISQLTEKIKTHKKAIYNNQIDEKK
jgi:predicted  nucleic acid-binding Zn-ribbon protein